jgi:uncharacterized protein YbjT (DUF2867 family)
MEIKRKTAFIFGSTGLVGSELLNLLIADNNYKQIYCFVRQAISLETPKVTQVVGSFDSLNESIDSIKSDEVYICLGTTIKKAGSQEKFRDVDYTYVVESARAGLNMGAKKIAVVSSAGADKDSNVFYSRVKGEMEQTISVLAYIEIHILRPSLLLGSRKEFRLAEYLSIQISKLLDPLIGSFLGKYRPVRATEVAAAMIQVMKNDNHSGKKVNFYASDIIRKIGNRYLKQ